MLVARQGREKRPVIPSTHRHSRQHINDIPQYDCPIEACTGTLNNVMVDLLQSELAPVSLVYPSVEFAGGLP